MASAASMPAYMMPGVSVHQPSHLEGDPTLATEILPGPPSVVSAQQSVQKRDPRKPSAVFSYLPPSDPGSTYSGLMHGTLIGQDSLDSHRTKRTRVDKGAATGRAQRASARNQNGATSIPDPTAINEVEIHSPAATGDIEPYTMIIDDETSISRSNSSLNMQEGPLGGAASIKSRRKDKGKGKEVEAPIVRVKEEPRTFSLLSPDPPVNLLNNDDHCSACRSYGALVYCDGCPRAFHLWCLDPPMESMDESDSKWFCPSCMIRKHPPRKPPASFMAPLLHHLKTTAPTEYQLPDDIRTFFKDVATGVKGTYVDSSEIKQPRLNRHGQLEDREPYRLRDRNGAPVLCFRCGTSALPGGLAAAAPATKRARRSSSKVDTSEAWKSIVSCDYCTLHWHLDCLDPPITTMPSFAKKWMCPNHAESIIPPKRRLPKQTVPPIDITKPGRFNNGQIEVIHPEIVPTIQKASGVAVDEVLINGRRYRVPERVIVLDFWSKVSKNEGYHTKMSDEGSGMSSPLTSLTSLEDMDDRIPLDVGSSSHTVNDLSVAQMLCSLQDLRTRRAPLSQPIVNGREKGSSDIHVQIDQEGERPVRGKAVKPVKATSASKNAPTKSASMNGFAKTQPVVPAPVYISTPVPPASTSTRRKRSAQVVQPEPSTRELRSRSRNDAGITSISARSSLRRADSSRDNLFLDGFMSAPQLPPLSSLGRSKAVNVKLEEVDNSQALINGSNQEAGPSSSALPKTTPKRARVIRRAPKDVEEAPKVERERRGRKRKVRDDDAPDEAPEPVILADQDAQEKDDKADKPKPISHKKKVLRTPSRQGHMAMSTNSTPLSSAISVPPPVSAPTTPSLKIRLPRLSNVHIANGSSVLPTSIPSATVGTPTRL